jgi:predicted amidohydrolase
VAEAIPGETTEFLARLAGRYGFWLVGGSILESVEGQERVHNTSIVFNPDGELVARYRKLHLFDVEVDGTTYQESATMAPGEEVVVASLAGVPVGLPVCYDLRFPELYRRLAAWGARLITVPSAFTMETGRDHWEVLLRARAIENQVYVLAAAQCGSHPPGHACYGNSMIIDPWGTVVARAGYREGVVAGSTSATRAQSCKTRPRSHRRAVSSPSRPAAARPRTERTAPDPRGHARQSRPEGAGRPRPAGRSTRADRLPDAQGRLVGKRAVGRHFRRGGRGVHAYHR